MAAKALFLTTCATRHILREMRARQKIDPRTDGWLRTEIAVFCDRDPTRMGLHLKRLVQQGYLINTPADTRAYFYKEAPRAKSKIDAELAYGDRRDAMISR